MSKTASLATRAPLATAENGVSFTLVLNMRVQNIAAYKFTALCDLKPLRARLLSFCNSHQLRGTILLSPEGINLFVAGVEKSIEKLLAELRGIRGLENLEAKVSESDHQPFNRMLVRIKKEIIAFGVPGVDPAKRTSPKLSPHTLKQWLDEGRPITLLDTRNDYEIKLGTFRNALPVGISNFRDFPDAVRKLPPGLKDKPVVMFCTGGIRCEKAGPFMESQGFKNLFQLEGGILKYFEECGGAHYNGECFVFDQRVGVDPALNETESDQCFNCLSPLTIEEQADARYVPGKSCLYCFKSPAEQIEIEIQRREERIRRVTTPLPGSIPYDNLRPISVPARCDGMVLLEFLGAVLKHVPPSEWAELASRELLLNRDRRPVALTQRVRAGERYFQKLPSIVEPNVSANIRILHEDEALIVVNKPAPLPMHPGGRYNRNTLQHVLNLVYHPQRPRPAHRLDANTTGVVLVTRTRHFASLLQPQFARGEIKKNYLARVLGWPEKELFACEAPIGVCPGEAGTRAIDPEEGVSARTEFKVLERLNDGTAMLEAVPVTGRTNQIRLHLWELGFPIYGDPIYLPNRKVGATLTQALEDPPLHLHAWKIELRHPLTREPISFAAPPPFEWNRTAHFSGGGRA